MMKALNVKHDNWNANQLLPWHHCMSWILTHTIAAKMSTSSLPGLRTSLNRVHSRIATKTAARLVKVVMMAKTCMFGRNARRHQGQQRESDKDSNEG